MVLSHVLVTSSFVPFLSGFKYERVTTAAIMRAVVQRLIESKKWELLLLPLPGLVSRSTSIDFRNGCFLSRTIDSPRAPAYPC